MLRLQADLAVLVLVGVVLAVGRLGDQGAQAVGDGGQEVRGLILGNFDGKVGGVEGLLIGLMDGEVGGSNVAALLADGLVQPGKVRVVVLGFKGQVVGVGDHAALWSRESG